MYALQSSQGGACIPTPWTSLQEQCVEEANDMTKQGNGSIHTCKHGEVGHSLAQYDHSGCGHWRRWVGRRRKRGREKRGDGGWMEGGEKPWERERMGEVSEPF